MNEEVEPTVHQAMVAAADAMALPEHLRFCAREAGLAVREAYHAMTDPGALTPIPEPFAANIAFHAWPATWSALREAHS